MVCAVPFGLEILMGPVGLTPDPPPPPVVEKVIVDSGEVTNGNRYWSVTVAVIIEVAAPAVAGRIAGTAVSAIAVGKGSNVANW